MASNSSTDAALDVLKWLEENKNFSSTRLKLLKQDLRYLRTFLRGAKKWSKHVFLKSDDNEKKVSLASFLHIIEDAVYKNLQVVNSHCLEPDDGIIDSHDLNQAFFKFGESIQVFNEEIEGWYIILLDWSSKFSSPMRDELTEFIDSLLQNLKDTRAYDMEELVEDLEEKVRFLKIFICFATMRGVEDEQLEDLLHHAEVVAITAAHIFYAYCFCSVDGMMIKISELLQKIKPVDPQVRETHIKVLTASKLSRSSNNLSLKVNKHILRDFIDSLRGNLWEILNCGSRIMDTVKDQMHLLYEGLSFLRNILTKQCDKFNELHEQTKNLVATVASQAGIAICALSISNMDKDLAEEINLELSDLMTKIKVIKSEVAVRDPVTARFNFPRTNELGFINFLLENMEELVRSGAPSIAFAKDQIETVQKDLTFIRSFLKDIAVQHNELEELQTLWNLATEVACKVEFFIDSLVIRDIVNCSPMLFSIIKEEIKLLKSKGLEIHETKKYENGKEKFTKSSSHIHSQVSTPIISEVVVGFDDEAEIIIDRLTRGTTQLDIVSIVGMAGLGKTTLAKKTYNDPSVVYYFHIRVWTCVSQQYNKQNLLLGILEGILTKLHDRFYKMNEDDLVEELYRSLKGKRYLIILDDVWDVAVWNELGMSFPNDSNGSRILLTSRLQNVALQAKPDSEPHLLRTLTDSESWDLLQKKLFHQDDCPQPLYELGMEIAKSCKGLPFSIVIVAGILATMEQHRWIEVVESLSSTIFNISEQCMYTLELSYKHLPDYLKPCLLYFGLFPEDQEIPICRLMWLWIAEGFVPKSDKKSLEDIAEDYMKDLLGRSLVMVAQKSSRGEVKACYVHDLLHEFCMAKAREENFAKLLRGYDELFVFYEPHGLRRLCIYSDGEHLRKSRLFCPHLRSLLLVNTDKDWHARDPSNVSFIFPICKLLKVLNLGKIKLGEIFPSEIELLVQLRYLALCGDMYFIPSSISNLWNLETFLIEGFSHDILLPDDVWTMKKLRHLHINKSVILGLPNDDQDTNGLYNLDTFSTPSLHFGPETEKVLRMLPNIRRLKCKISESWDATGDCSEILALDFLSRLESLRVFSTGKIQKDFEFAFPLNLKKLTLSEFMLPWTEISVIGKLPNLEVLKLLSGAFQGGIWDMEEDKEEFPKLKFLKLEFLDIVSWTSSADPFLPRLEKLVLKNCWNLEEVPFALGDISTLQMIEVYRCQHCLARLVKDIQEEQESMGNDGLKILIHAPGWNDEE